MKHLLKIIYFILFVSLFISLLPPHVSAGTNQVSVIFNNKQILFKSQPIFKKNVVLVPVKAFVDAIGASMKWQPKEKTIQISLEEKTVKLVIDKKTAYVNGRKVNQDYPAFMIKNDTYVPLRFVSVSLGINFEWDTKNKIIYLTKLLGADGLDYSNLTLKQIYDSNVTTSTEIYYSAMKLISDPTNTKKKILIKFDLSSLKGKKIKNAYLSMFNGETLDATSKRTIRIGEVQKSWNASANWETSDGVNNWENEGAMGLSDEKQNIATQTTFRVVGWEPSWFINISSIVKDWTEGNTSNNGLAIEFDQYFQLAGLTAINEPTLAPSLVIEWDDINYNDKKSVYTKKIKTALDAVANKYVNHYWGDDNIGILNTQYNLSKLGLSDVYRKNLIQFFDYYIDENGDFRRGAAEKASFYNGEFGNLLLQLYQDTQDSRYLKAVQNIRKMFDTLPQVDGIYTENGVIQGELSFLALDFLARYGEQFSDENSINLAINLAIKLYDKLTQNTNGIPASLMWPNGSTNGVGWARGEGWFFAGLGKLFQFESIKNHPMFPQLVKRYTALALTLASYQQDSGLWRNVIQDKTTPVETSGSALIALGFEYGVQEGVLNKRYENVVNSTINGLQNYSKTGMEMSQSFPSNMDLIYSYTDLSNTRKGFAFWLQLLSTKELYNQIIGS